MSSQEDKPRPRRASKRKAQQQAEEKNDDSEQDDLSYRWIDAGNAQEDGRMEHAVLEVVVGCVVSIVSVGDAIMLRSGDDDTKEDSIYRDDDEDYYRAGDKQDEPTKDFVARVERMWEEPVRKNEDREACMKIRARWYFKKQDMISLRDNLTAPISSQQILSVMTNRDLILSNQADDNDVLTVVGKCTVLKRRPTQHPEPRPPLPPQTFVCQYGINFGGSSSPGTAVVAPYEGENDDWPSSIEASDGEQEGQEMPSKRARTRSRANDDQSSFADKSSASSDRATKTFEHSDSKAKSSSSASSPASSVNGASSDGIVPPYKSGDSSSSSSSDDDEMGLSDDMSSSSFAQEEEVVKVQETEGSTTSGHIHIGPEYQVAIPSYDPDQVVRSRNPTMIWKPNALQDDVVDGYFADAANILFTFLEKNELLTEDPYTPIPVEKMEAMPVPEDGSPVTISHVSTGASLSRNRNRLTRECRVDALMEVLHKNDYDTKAALEAVAASPRDFLTMWTKGEKELFDAGFRRYNGSLRMVGKGVAKSKSFADVVDYHYRFKIPDQFRRYQEKKREQAVRMMECIEKKRCYEPIIHSLHDMTLEKNEGSGSAGASESVGEKGQLRDWTKTSGTELVGTTDERRVSAKELLLEVQSVMGNETMAQVAGVMKGYKLGSIPDLRETLEEILQEQPEILARFMDFFPKRFQT